MVSMEGNKRNRTRVERGRWTSQRKTEVVLRLLRGEDLDALSRELKISTGRIAQWREEFLAGGQANLKSRETDARDEEIKRLRAKVGEQTMDLEVLQIRLDMIECRNRPQQRRSKP